MNPIPPRTTTDILVDGLKTAISFGLREAIRHPEIRQMIQQSGPVVSQPPAQAFAPLQGCPWCNVAEALAGANVYLRRALDSTDGNYYVHQAKVVLNRILGSLAVSQGPVLQLHPQVNALLVDLVGTTTTQRQPLDPLAKIRVENVADRADALIQVAFAGGEGKDILPLLVQVTPPSTTLPYRASVPAGDANGSPAPVPANT